MTRGVSMKRSGHSSFLNKEEVESKQQKPNIAAGKVTWHWEENKPSRECKRKERK